MKSQVHNLKIPSPFYQEYPYEDGAGIGNHRYLCPAIVRGLSVLPDKARVLDIGCGNGSLTAAWANNGWDVTGIDPSESGIAHAKSCHPHIAFLHMPVGPGVVEQFGERSFDAIVSAEVVEHLYAPRQLAESSFRLLKDGGVLIMTTPYHGYFKNLVMAATGTMDRHWTALWDGGHIKFWSSKTMAILLTEAGFTGLEFGGAGRLPYLWKSMVVRAWKSKP
ncbi:MAG TPA: class I SAM-dependent methyltransferase [Candidatus Acidoferrales bacterium]|nr:class I SAM-dependent methyltransferase [Candidatus Acidoferrales bacterium]